MATRNSVPAEPLILHEVAKVKKNTNQVLVSLSNVKRKHGLLWGLIFSALVLLLNTFLISFIPGDIPMAYVMLCITSIVLCVTYIGSHVRIRTTSTVVPGSELHTPVLIELYVALTTAVFIMAVVQTSGANTMPYSAAVLCVCCIILAVMLANETVDADVQMADPAGSPAAQPPASTGSANAAAVPAAAPAGSQNTKHIANPLWAKVLAMLGLATQAAPLQVPADPSTPAAQEQPSSDQTPMLHPLPLPPPASPSQTSGPHQALPGPSPRPHNMSPAVQPIVMTANPAPAGTNATYRQPSGSNAPIPKSTEEMFEPTPQNTEKMFAARSSFAASQEGRQNQRAVPVFIPPPSTSIPLQQLLPI